jgi:uncharacterized protein (DUF2336 family)
MPRIARELDDASKAVALARMFLHAAEPAAGDLDLQLWKLLKKGSSILRAEVAEQLAPLVNGPPRTLRALAHDPDPEVAGPVLQRSAAISNTAIAEMARCKGDKHSEAIAARRNLHEKITGILIRRGGLSVLAALGGNETAAISAEGLHHLTMRLRHHEQASRRVERRLQHPGARRRIATAVASS